MTDAPPSEPARRRRILVGLVVVIALVVVGLFVLKGSGKKSTTSPTTAPSPSSSLPTTTGTGSSPTTGPSTSLPGSTVTGPPAPPGLKAVIHGLIDRSGMPPAGYPVNAWVVQVDWSALQPQQGGPIAANNAIDMAIAQAQAMNAHGGHVALKLRVYAGINSPPWAMQLGGAPFPVTDASSGVSGMSPRFWTPQFDQAYAALQTALAAKYDNVPEIREVVMSQCTTVFAEPFRRQVTDQASLNAWLSAGYTMAADQACQESEIKAHEVWQKTSSDLTLNPFLPVELGQGTKAAPPNLAFPISVMQDCREQLGVRCVLENNSLKSDPTAAYSQLYQAMDALGGPITFQTAQTATVGDLPTAVALGAQLGAASIELPASYKNQSPAQLQASLGPAITQLQSNPAP